MTRFGASTILVLGVVLGCEGRSSRSDADGGERGGESGASGASTGGTASGGSGGSLTGGTAAGGSSAGAPPNPLNEEVACTQNSDCVLTMKRCCACNPATIDDTVAVNTAHRDAFDDRKCTGVATCAGCTPTEMPYFLAACVEERCVAVDLLTTDITACTEKADCKMRAARCCGCGPDATYSLLAIRTDKDAEYESLRCDLGSTCSECAAAVPEGPDRNLGCVSGHCAIGGFVP